MAIIFQVVSFWWPLSIALKLLAFNTNDYFARSAFCGVCSERSRVNHSFRDKSETPFSMPRCHYELRLCRICVFLIEKKSVPMLRTPCGSLAKHRNHFPDLLVHCISLGVVTPCGVNAYFFSFINVT